MRVIAYTYDADTHCEHCTLAYPGVKTDEFGDLQGEDSEGNKIHPLFDTDEWYLNDVFEGNDTATLVCGTCGEVIETLDLTD